MAYGINFLLQIRKCPFDSPYRNFSPVIFLYPADHFCFHPEAFGNLQCPLRPFLRQVDLHPVAHVEDPVHLLPRCRALLINQSEERRNFKELVFDYLKDRIQFGRRPGSIQLAVERLKGAGQRSAKLLLRGLPFAIVDEADSVLIDEARTPLIISGRSPFSAEADAVYFEAIEISSFLE